jgi:DNA end-binding protein Ku
MEALQRALDNARAGKDPRAEADADGESNGDGQLDGLSRDELYERAQKQGIPGRTKMSKKELVAALTEHTR